MLTLRVHGGELEQQPWVYAWLSPGGVVYVGATGLHPATRTWLHLHDDDPNVGRLRARYPELADEELEVVAVRLSADVDRQRVRHGAVALLAERGLLADRHVCDPPLDASPHPETDAFVAALEEHLGR
jgi:hypothetical protein